MSKILECVCGTNLDTMVKKSMMPDAGSRRFLALTKNVWRHVMHTARRGR